jgi:hypothetical protein
MSVFYTTLDCGDLGEMDAEVRFKYYKGYPGSYWEPPEPECVEVIEVLIGKKLDVLSYLHHDTIDRIEQEALDHIKAQLFEAQVEAAERRAEDLKGN